MAAILELNPLPAGDAPVAAQAPAPAAAVVNTAPGPGTTLLDIVQRAVQAEKPDMPLLTSVYVKLRNTKKDLDEQAKTKTRPLVEGMELIEACFLAKMLELGVDSLKNERGTPYKTEQVSITVADNATFMDFILTRALEALPVSEQARVAIKSAIVESGHLALLEARASKSAVEALLEETKELPPGLNRRVEAKVNVRTAPNQS